MLGIHVTRRTPNKPLFGIRSGSPQSHMPRLRTKVNIPLQEIIFWVHFLFFPNFLEILVKFSDFLQTSWPTLKIPDFFQTYRHHVNRVDQKLVHMS